MPITISASKLGENAEKVLRPSIRPALPPLRRKYNLLKIAPTSFFADYGCHVRIYEEARILQKRGNDVTICTYPTGRNIDGLRIFRSLSTPWNRAVQVGSSLHKVYYDALLFLKSCQVAQEIRPNLVHGHLHEGACIGYPISRMYGVPLVFDFQGSLTSEMLDHNFLKRSSLAFRPLRRLESIINRIADVVITSSRNAAEILIHNFGYPEEKVFTLCDSVDTDLFRPRWEVADCDVTNRLWQRLGIPPGRKVVVYLGLLAEYQGTTKLLQAAALLVKRGLPVHFLVIGFPGIGHYQAVARELGIANHTTFTGRIPYHEGPYYLALGDVAVSPKMSETEGNGKLLNYMAVGLPIVTFDTPVAREVMGDLGVYARLGNVEDLARKIESLLAEERAAQELGMRLREKAVSECSWDRAGEKLLAIYDWVWRQSRGRLG